MPVEDGSLSTAKGRFALRLAAIVWPLLTYWQMAEPGSCGPALLRLTPPVLTLLGVVALLVAVNADRRRQRYALAAAATIAAAWVAVVVFVRWIAAGTDCGLF